MALFQFCIEPECEYSTLHDLLGIFLKWPLTSSIRVQANDAK